MSTPSNHDEYITAAPEQFRPLLEKLRAAIKRALPESQEIMAYNLPGFSFGGPALVSYAAFSKQCGLYLPAAAIAECADALAEAGIKSTKTGVTFSPAKPIPDDLLKRLLAAARKSLSA